MKHLINFTSILPNIDLSKCNYYSDRQGRIYKRKLKTDEMKEVDVACNNGYKVLWVQDMSGKRTAVYYHVIIASQYLGYNHQDTKQKVCHLDYNKENNSVENLKVTDIAGHREHYLKTFQKMTGVSRLENMPHNKLKENDVIKIKKLLLKNTPVKTIVKQFDVSLGQIYRIKRNDNWSHIQVSYNEQGLFKITKTTKTTK